MADNLYYWDEVSLGTFRRKLLGEILTDFNFSFTIDGAKDSAKVNLVSYTKNQIKPYTIIEHEKTNTWWVVASDRIERFQNDDGFYYVHELELVGAIELLNACDLVDCGCLSDRYSLNDIITKLIKLSPNTKHLPTFEINSPNLDLNQIVNYTKTFENYTLLSALREMFDGYNCAIKLEFEKATSSGITYLSKTKIKVISKTGDGTIVQESVFNFIQEKTNINKNSYGTSVVSNVQNAISSKAKTYPAVGSVRLSGTEYTITHDKAVVRLPTPVYDINWIKMFVPLTFTVRCYQAGVEGQTFRRIIDKTQANTELKDFIFGIFTNYGVSVPARLRNKDIYTIIDRLDKASTIMFYGGNTYDPLEKKIYPPTGKKAPAFAFGARTHTAEPSYYSGPVYLVEKTIYDTLYNPKGGSFFYWERGTNIISGFNFFKNVGADTDVAQVWYWRSTQLTPEDWSNGDDLFTATYGELVLQIRLNFDSVWIPSEYDNCMATDIDTSDVRFVVNYIPMSDLKIKYDNVGFSNLSNLYNQTGKITDSVALSKLMLSHSKEIESDKITKYASFYNFNLVPKVGNVVNVNNEKYVIESISLDFQQNEYDKYYIESEIVITKSVATKSIMTNPDTNIRNYNIPQNLNVKRKQLYRDFYEITHTRENSATPLQDVKNVINLSNTYVPYAEHTAVMKLTYDGYVGMKDTATWVERLFGIHHYEGGNDTFYYQLDATTFIMKKAIYEVVDFKDNNIIGYDAMNSTSGFKLNEIINHNADNICTPISYVDDYGKVKGIEIAFCNGDSLSDVYLDYLTYNNATELSGGIMNYSVFIDSQIYEGVSGEFFGAKYVCDYKIEEENYNKDAIEVPVFEYACQFDDSNDVIVGDNIFDGQEDDLCYFYSLYLVDKGTIDNNNYGTMDISPIYLDEDIGLTMYYRHISCKFEIGGASKTLRNIKISKYDYMNYPLDDNEVEYHTAESLATIVEETNKDLVIIRHTVKKDYTVDENDVVSCTKDLMFVIKNLENANIDNGDIVLQLNCYNVN